MQQYHSLAITRNIPLSFVSDSLKQEQPETPISIETARTQHKQYVSTLCKYIHDVVELEEDENHADCCFVEDTAIVLPEAAVITHLGAASRRGEELEIIKTLQKRTNLQLHRMESPACCDGGDVLYIPTTKDLFVGETKRTNKDGIAFLKSAFCNYIRQGEPIPIKLPKGLHLKSFITCIPRPTSHKQGSAETKDILVIAEGEVGEAIWKQVQAARPESYDVFFVPQVLASNVLVVKPDPALIKMQLGSEAEVEWVVLYQGDAASSKRFQELSREINGGQEKAAKQVVLFENADSSELAKADGALTCCSLLVYSDTTAQQDKATPG